MSPDNIGAFHCPRWAELPAISLYMDQVIIVLEESIGLFANERERVLTSTMVNNYVKQRLMAPPEKKKYGREHLAMLVVVSVLKRVLSMSEITALVDMLSEAHGFEAAYDVFCDKLEAMLEAFFVGGALLAAPAPVPDADALLDAALTALGGKLYLQWGLAAARPEAPDPPAKGKAK